MMNAEGDGLPLVPSEVAALTAEVVGRPVLPSEGIHHSVVTGHLVWSSEIVVLHVIPVWFEMNLAFFVDSSCEGLVMKKQSESSEKRRFLRSVPQVVRLTHLTLYFREVVLVGDYLHCLGWEQTLPWVSRLHSRKATSMRITLPFVTSRVKRRRCKSLKINWKRWTRPYYLTNGTCQSLQISLKPVDIYRLTIRT